MKYAFSLIILYFLGLFNLSAIKKECFLYCLRYRINGIVNVFFDNDFAHSIINVYVFLER